jgi:hypothetical protein
MSDESKSAKIDVPMLVAAFPSKHGAAALAAAKKVIGDLDLRYWWGNIAAEIDGETVLIPNRLHFASNGVNLSTVDKSALFSRALETRSTDGYQRQRALNDLLQHPQSWSAPFIVLLIGGYVIEILNDIRAALTPELVTSLEEFITDNNSLWETTKRQVTSYWNAYYRDRWRNEGRPVFSREEYVGFSIIDLLETAAAARDHAASE